MTSSTAYRGDIPYSARRGGQDWGWGGISACSAEVSAATMRERYIVTVLGLVGAGRRARVAQLRVVGWFLKKPGKVIDCVLMCASTPAQPGDQMKIQLWSFLLLALMVAVDAAFAAES